MSSAVRCASLRACVFPPRPQILYFPFPLSSSRHIQGSLFACTRKKLPALLGHPDHQTRPSLSPSLTATVLFSLSLPHPLSLLPLESPSQCLLSCPNRQPLLSPDTPPSLSRNLLTFHQLFYSKAKAAALSSRSFLAAGGGLSPCLGKPPTRLECTSPRLPLLPSSPSPHLLPSSPRGGRRTVASASASAGRVRLGSPFLFSLARTKEKALGIRWASSFQRGLTSVTNSLLIFLFVNFSSSSSYLSSHRQFSSPSLPLLLSSSQLSPSFLSFLSFPLFPSPSFPHVLPRRQAGPLPRGASRQVRAEGGKGEGEERNRDASLLHSSPISN